MGEKNDTSGRRVRAKTAVRGKRYLCAKCRKRSPKPVTTPAPWYCPNCRPTTESTRPDETDRRRDP
jgi:ribosomal protein L37AE/L43A